MTVTLSGAELAAGIRARVAAAAAELAADGTPPRLAVVVATADESSVWYVHSIARAAEKTGIACSVVDLGETATPERIRAELAGLSGDPAVHGIILQTPLPADAVFEDLAASIDPAKDVDGANPLSLGRLAAGLPAFAPATAEAVLTLLDHHGIPLSGAHAVVVGRSNVVGKPAAHLLLQRDATVTVCHRGTKDLAEITRSANVLVAAVGRPDLITAEHVAEDAVVLDVGTNPTPTVDWSGTSTPSRSQRASPDCPRCPAGSARSPPHCSCSTRSRPRAADPRPSIAGQSEAALTRRPGALDDLCSSLRTPADRVSDERVRRTS